MHHWGKPGQGRTSEGRNIHQEVFQQQSRTCVLVLSFPLPSLFSRPPDSKLLPLTTRMGLPCLSSSCLKMPWLTCLEVCFRHYSVQSGWQSWVTIKIVFQSCYMYFLKYLLLLRLKKNSPDFLNVQSLIIVSGNLHYLTKTRGQLVSFSVLPLSLHLILF